MKRLIVLSLVIASPALAQNAPGVRSEGTVTLGNCVQFGSTTNRIKDAGAPCNQQQVTIGQPVVGATPNMCLVIDANGKLAQASCLLAQ